MIDLETIQNALRIAAQVVARDGERYLPIYLRLEKERDKIIGQSEALKRVHSLLDG